MEYFGPEVANAASLTSATPKWQFKCDPEKNKTSFCDYGLGSIKSMRTYKENGVENVVGIAKGKGGPRINTNRPSYNGNV